MNDDEDAFEAGEPEAMPEAGEDGRSMLVAIAVFLAMVAAVVFGAGYLLDHFFGGQP